MRPFPLTLAIALACLWASPSPASAQRTVDQERLATLFAEREFTPPDDFKALVVRIERGEDGSLVDRYFDFAGTADDRDDWWAASSVKIYAVVAAVERIHALGFPITAWVTFEYEDGPFTMRMDEIVRRALEDSSNAAFDRLVEIVGFDSINTDFFVADNGFEDTVFLRAYSGRHIDEATRQGTNRFSPRIVLRRGARRAVIPARVGAGRYSCPDQGNCTTLFELAEVMSRIMLHEELPDDLRYDLRPEDLRVIRDALEVAQNRELLGLISAPFGETPVRVFHKPGFANQWVTDVMYVHRTDTDERYVVAMSARPGRRSLDAAATTIGALLAAGELR